ncbi:hypothetical protein KBD59_03080 [Candidatus Gracilibacteria bacterium]|nr:hypothetical protein [Candidatus Gracilibacteria bacterium]
MQKIFSITAVTILTLSLSACMASTNTVNTTTESVSYSDPQLFDECPGIDAYENMAFYNSLIVSLKINSTPALLPAPEDEVSEDAHYIVGACYSEKLKTALVLTNTAYELGGAAFGIFEYDTRTNTVLSAIHADSLPYPSIFGERSGTKIDLVDTVCAPSESDAPGDCPENSATYQYDLESHQIVEKKA